MYFGYNVYIFTIKLFIDIFIINIIIIVFPAMYEVKPFEKGLLYRKMWPNKSFYLSNKLLLSAFGSNKMLNS